MRRLLLFLVFLVGCQKGGRLEEHVLRGKAMGTTWTLRYVGDEVVDLPEAIADRVEALEQIFSTWREASVVSRLNRGETLALPAEYQQVLDIAMAVKAKSGGVFDVAIGEDVKAAGFGSEYSGRLDFSGIAKGFAIDQVGALLKAAGVDEFLFEFGGELLGRGDRDWRVGLESPDLGELGKVRRVITLHDQAVATSGSYRLFRGEKNHLIDPRTGRSVAHDCVSVSVMADTCAEADAWATALMVLGAEEGRALAERLGLRAYFVRRVPDGGFEEVTADFAD